MATEKEELEARAAAVRAERASIGNPMYAAVHAQRHSAEEARIDNRLREIDASLPPGVNQETIAATARAEHAKLAEVDPIKAATSPDLLVKAKRAELRAARERLAAENPMAEAAFVLRNGWAFIDGGDEQ